VHTDLLLVRKGRMIDGTSGVSATYGYGVGLFVVTARGRRANRMSSLDWVAVDDPVDSFIAGEPQRAIPDAHSTARMLGSVRNLTVAI
jgi:hypothetical protein